MSNEKDTKTKSKKNKKDKSSSVVYSYSHNYKKCCHDAQPVLIGSYTIYVTAYKNVGESAKGFHPDVGLYFDSDWDKLFKNPNVYGEVKGFGDYPGRYSYPAIVIDWSDWKGIDIDIMAWLVDGAINNLRDSRKLDVGCYGGHGRTGTFLACLAGKLENLDARAAILAVRKRYCEEAVESYSQVGTVASFLKSQIPFDLVKVAQVQNVNGWCY
jgi:hypothetical protein